MQVSPRPRADMQVQLKEESAFVAQKSKETDELIVIVGKESVIAEEEGAKAVHDCDSAALLCFAARVAVLDASSHDTAEDLRNNLGSVTCYTPPVAITSQTTPTYIT